MPKIAPSKTSSTATRYRAGRTFTAVESIQIQRMRAKPELQRSAKNIEAAIYSYVRAVRALGKTQISTSEIAKALGLSVSDIGKVLPKLNDKGIKLAG
jgi:DNA-binding MarR family transcriptional regulator